jgi:g-D-glutamyl-meso-diaminopimelate peptidase
MYHFTNAHDFKLILAYHTQGQVIYWKYLDYEPEGSRQIAEYFSKVSGYLLEDTPYASGFAGYKDWFIESRNRPGYTVEAGLGDNPLPMSQFSHIYYDNRYILLGGMTQLL